MRKLIITGFMLVGLFALLVGSLPYKATASSHREAPYTSTDPEVDATDLYAFISNDRRDSVTMIANYIPLQDPASGPNFFRFGEGVLYEINIDNDGDAKDNITFQFRFRTEITNPNTFLYNTGPITSIDDPDLNLRQFYSVSVLGAGGENDPLRGGTVIANDIPVPPYYVGPKSFPEGYEKVAMQGVRDIGNGIKVFAGPRDDPFFVDLGGTFDLLSGIRGVDDLSHKNVHTIAIQVPIVGLQGPNDTVIGLRTSAYRKAIQVQRRNAKNKASARAKLTGKETKETFVQLSRLDMPLVNEAVLPLALKDAFNSISPAVDAPLFTGDTPAGNLLKKSILDPELARLMRDIMKINVPPAPRNDILTVFLTGIPTLNQPAKVVPSSQLRLNMAIAPAAAPNRMGLLGGDASGFPNGRRLADDVVDASLQVVAGATPFTPGFEANNKLGDGVNGNDKPFKPMFPYVAEPHAYVDEDKK